MTAFKAMAMAAVVLFASSIVRADGTGDTHVNNGGGPGGSTACGSVVEFAAPTGSPSPGSLSADCENEGTTLLTKITFSVLASNTIGPLTCTSDMGVGGGNLSAIGWTEKSITGAVDSCTFMAPSSVSPGACPYLASIGDPCTANNAGDHDCDLDDFLVGIPHGCDFTAETVDGTVFTPGAEVGLSVNGIPSLITAPEPSSALLLLVGLGAGFPFLRRKLAR